MGLDLMEDLIQVLVLLSLDISAKANALLVQTLFNDLVQPVKGAAADEEDVPRIHLDEILVRVLPAALGRYIGHGALHNFQQRLLHTLAGDVPGNGSVLALPGDLVDLVHVDNAVLGPLHVKVRRLEQAQEDVLHIVAHIARLGKGCGVGNGEGDL